MLDVADHVFELDRISVVAIDGMEAGGATGVVVGLRDDVELDPGLHAARIIARRAEIGQEEPEAARGTGWKAISRALYNRAGGPGGGTWPRSGSESPDRAGARSGFHARHATAYRPPRP